MECFLLKYTLLKHIYYSYQSYDTVIPVTQIRTLGLRYTKFLDSDHSY